MEEESFEDPDVAELLNRNFISIKVDREERPDIDAVYMQVCQAMTGQGGWPLTILMSPDQEPFFAGTYFPKQGRYGSAGLMELLKAAAEQWEKGNLQQSGRQLSKQLRSMPYSGKPSAAKDAPAPASFAEAAYEQLQDSFDESFGGFGGAPKFPTPHILLFLLRRSIFKQDPAALRMAEKTLVQMYRGGIFDHIGGGFSRYSTDRRWLVPHFEKMLYDNALLIYVYAEAYLITKKPLYKEIAEKTISYVLRELTGSDGAFYSAQDADSGGREGAYYLLDSQELRQVLTQEEAALFCSRFGISEEGNFEGRNIPNLLHNGDWQTELPQIRKICEKLYHYRLKRYSLLTDDKIITGWNCLMIAGLAKAYTAFGVPAYLDAALRADQILSASLTDSESRLWISRREGRSRGTGTIDDYAYRAFALLHLYEATWEPHHLIGAVRFAEQIPKYFQDEHGGGFYLTAADSEALLLRPKETYDGALPSGNSVAAFVFQRLAALTGSVKWFSYTDSQLAFLVEAGADYPMGHCFAAVAMLDALSSSEQLLCCAAGKSGRGSSAEIENGILEKLMQYQAACYYPGRTVLLKTERTAAALEKIAPFTAAYPIPQKDALYYLCRNNTCLPPAADPFSLPQLR